MNNTIFTQAKIEYNKQLIDILLPPIFDKFREIYNDSKGKNSENEAFR